MANSTTNRSPVGESALQLTAPRPASSSGVLRPVVSLQEVQAVWSDYLKLEDILLDDKDYLYFVVWSVGQKEQRVACASLQVAEKTRKKVHGRIDRTKKKSAYRKMSVFFGLTIPRRDGVPDIEIHELSSGIVKVERGDGYIGTLYMKKPPGFDVVRAEFAITVTAPNGRSIVGHGACSASERGFTHPDHDVISTAWTRALNRGISDMIGMGEVSAEELADDGVVGNGLVVEGKTVKRPVRPPARPAPAKPAPIKPAPASLAKAKPAVEKAQVATRKTQVAAEPGPRLELGSSPGSSLNSEPRNLGEFLASAITGFNLTVPKVIEILGVKDLGEIEDWGAALRRVRVAKEAKS